MLDLLFLLSFIVPAPFWLMMLVAPRGAFTRRLLNSYAAFLILGAMYLFTLFGALFSTIGQGGGLNFSSLEALAQGFAVPSLALVGWIHLVALDLAGGYWILSHAERSSMPVTALRFFLLFTLLAGPFGIFCFVMWRLLTGAARRPARA